MKKPDINVSHINNETLEKTKEAFMYSATKGRVNTDVLILFTGLFEKESERTEFLSNVYNSCVSDTDKKKITRMCTNKDWNFNIE